jgi:hypothetical protein
MSLITNKLWSFLPVYCVAFFLVRLVVVNNLVLNQYQKMFVFVFVSKLDGALH